MTVKKERADARLSTLVHTLVICFSLISSRAHAQNCIVFGTYSSLPTASYSCGIVSPPIPLVTFNYSAWVFTNQGGGNIRVDGSPGGSPPFFAGTLNCNDSTFTVNGIVSGGASGCTETYSLEGRFTSDTSWTGTFRVMFTGIGCSATNCIDQTFPVSGRTNHVTGVSVDPIPVEASLDQNFPNPFNPTTQIRFSLSQTSAVTLNIYNTLGQHIETLVNERLAAGTHSVHWNPRDLPSGIYCYRLQTGQVTETKHLVLLR